MLSLKRSGGQLNWALPSGVGSEQSQTLLIGDRRHGSFAASDVCAPHRVAFGWWLQLRPRGEETNTSVCCTKVTTFSVVHQGEL